MYEMETQTETKGSIELVLGPMFSGKCFSKDTKVRMYDSTLKNVQDIVPGDILLGDDMKPRNVLSCSSGKGKLYVVRFMGGHFKVNGDHILSLKYLNYDPINIDGIDYSFGDTVDISVTRYLKELTPHKKTYFHGYSVPIEYHSANGTNPDTIYDKYEYDRAAGEFAAMEYTECNLKERTIKENVAWRFGFLDQFFFQLTDTNDKTSDSWFGEIKDKKLRQEILEMARSIGLRCWGLDYVTVEKCSLKQLLFEKYNSYPISVDESPEQEEDYYGFMVDGNHRFVLENGCVVHNSSELIRQIRRFTVSGKTCLVIKYRNDNRYDEKCMSTHDKVMWDAISTFKLYDVYEDAKKHDIIGIDEGQFFPDIVEFCEEMANLGKVVVVVALDGTFQRKAFGRVLELIPLSENVKKLSAICFYCKKDAGFTKRTVDSNEIELIGGSESYVAACRSCFDLQRVDTEKRKILEDDVANENKKIKE